MPARFAGIKAWLGTALLLVVSVGVALGVGEAAVRRFQPAFLQGEDPIRNPFWRHDPRIGWSHRPGQRGLFQRAEFSHPVEINGSGWRDRERGAHKEPGSLRVAVLGDSFTWGHGVGDEAIFTRLMERDLPGVEVLNFGLSGAASDQQLLILRDHVLPAGPDLVLVMVSRNDFAALLESREGSYFKPRFVLQEDGGLRLTGVPVPEVSPIARWHYRLRRRSALLNLVESRLESLPWVEAGPSGDTPSAGSRSADAYALMRAILGAMAAESRERGARFAIGLVPSSAHTYLVPIPPVELRRHEVLRGIASFAGFPVLDLVPAFREAAADPATASRVRLHYPRDGHWNEMGHALAALELVRLLRAEGLLPVAPGDAPL